MHIYAFGSVCRGDVTNESDIDLLALVRGQDSRFNPDKFSIYTYQKIDELWRLGNPFAWHLALESKLLHSTNGVDYLRELGRPNPYISGFADCSRFRVLVLEARASIKNRSRTIVFDLSTIFLGIRNFATCFSLAMCDAPVFARDSALRLGDYSAPIDRACYEILQRARLLSARGIGENLKPENVQSAIDKMNVIGDWMDKLLNMVKNNARIQQ